MRAVYTIVIPFNIPWEWSTDYTNQTAMILSKNNLVICYMWADRLSLKDHIQQKEPLRLVKRESNNLYLFYPTLWLPFRNIKSVSKINEFVNYFLLKILLTFLHLKHKTKQKIVWIFDPATKFLADNLGNKWTIIYDCVDFWNATAEDKKTKNEILRNENKLTKDADLVTAISPVLKNHLEKFNKNVLLVPQGFRQKDFEKKNNYMTKRIKAKKPIIGFAGAVNHRLDYKLLLPLAKNNPNWSFVIWGPVLESNKLSKKNKKLKRELLNLPNVSTGFLKNRKKLPGIYKQFDIAMIPYDIKQDFNKYCYPMKVFEYFYSGKPVVSTDILALRQFPKYVKIGKNYNEWEKIINNLLKNPWSKNIQREEMKLAKNNSWENKINKIISSL